MRTQLSAGYGGTCVLAKPGAMAAYGGGAAAEGEALRQS